MKYLLLTILAFTFTAFGQISDTVQFPDIGGLFISTDSEHCWQNLDGTGFDCEEGETHYEIKIYFDTKEVVIWSGGEGSQTWKLEEIISMSKVHVYLSASKQDRYDKKDYSIRVDGNMGILKLTYSDGDKEHMWIHRLIK